LAGISSLLNKVLLKMEELFFAPMISILDSAMGAKYSNFSSL